MFECTANTDNFVGCKIKLYPTEDQKKILNKNIDLYRFVYNWSLNYIQDHYHKTKKFVVYIEITNDFALFRNSDGNEWLKDYPLNSARIAVRSAIKAFRYFFDKRNKFPKFKNKRKSKKIFGVRGERIYLNSNGYASIEGMGPNNKILYKDSPIPKTIENPKIYNAWVSYDGDDYWLSFQYENYRHYDLDIPKSEPLGIDVGLRKLATLSDGSEYISPETRKLEKRIQRLNRKASKCYNKMIEYTQRTKTKFEDIQKTNNLLKIEKQLRKTRRTISNRQNTYIHTISKEIVNKNPEFIVMETVNLNDMVHVKNKQGKLVVKKGVARGVYKYNIGKFFHCIEYKAKERDIPVIRADRDYPSTQLCSNCGFQQKIDNAKIYKCPCCGIEIDRDYNAALNLRSFGYQNLR